MTVLKNYAQERQQLDRTQEEDSRLLYKYPNKAFSDKGEAHSGDCLIVLTS